MKEKIKRGERIFLSILAIEIILVLILIPIKIDYPNPCVTPDFFHPFGKTMEPGMNCIQVIASGPSPFLYLSLYILIITAIVFIYYTLKNRVKHPKK